MAQNVTFQQIAAAFPSLPDLHHACRALGLPASNRHDDMLTRLANSGYTIQQMQAAVAQTPRQSITTPQSAVPAIPSAAPSMDMNQVAEVVTRTVTEIDNKLRSDVSEQLKKVVDAVKVDIKSIRDEMPKLIANMPQPNVEAEVVKAVAAAFKPIQKQFEAAPAEVRERVQAAAPRERKRIRDVFDLSVDVTIGGDDTCEVYGQPYGFDPDYVWDIKALKAALVALKRGGNIFLHGERGTGKSEFARNFACRTGRPFFQVSCHANMESADFIGAEGLKKGDTAWKDGVVLQGYRTEGAIILIDEVSFLRPEWAAELHKLLETRSKFRVTKTGELVARATGTMFIVADNTNGCGDETGRYAGTRPQNSAMLDRFTAFPSLKFLEPKQEIEVLVTKHGAKKDDATKLINVFTKCRAEVGASLVEPPSLRRAIAFIEMLEAVAPAEAWDMAIVQGSPQMSQEALRQLFTAHWK